MSNRTIDHPNVVSEAAWLAARKELLERERTYQQRDELSRQRRELPWVKIDKNYVFDGPQGKQTLADLFQGKSQIDCLPFHVWP